jgi:hypothetical protein
MINAGLWLVRVILYGAAGYLAVFIIYPNISNYFLSFIVGGVLAAVIIAFETLVSAKGKKHSFETEVKQRMFAIDKLMSSQPMSADRRLESGQTSGYLQQSSNDYYEDAEIIDDEDDDYYQEVTVTVTEAETINNNQKPQFPDYKE